MLRARLGPAARRLPTWPMPDFVIWLGSFLSPTLAMLYPQLGLIRNSSSEKARCFAAPEPSLHWKPHVQQCKTVSMLPGQSERHSCQSSSAALACIWLTAAVYQPGVIGSDDTVGGGARSVQATDELVHGQDHALAHALYLKCARLLLTVRACI